MKQPIIERIAQWIRTHMRVPLGVKIAVCVLPAVLVALFYMLRSNRGAMDWVTAYIAHPVRRSLGMLSSIYPIAVMEVLCTIAAIFLIYYIIKAIRDSLRRRKKWKLLGKRALGLLVAACYLYGAFCWLWSSGYHATGFTEKHGFSDAGIETRDLIAVTRMFAEKANELSVLLERDEDGSLISDRREMLTQSRYIYRNISREFTELRGTVYAPKPMYLYSWLMTITRYSGVYFALTGEAMFNTQEHAAFMPATVAHEIAHQLGVAAEDEATLVGILACVTSDNPVFEYAGYLRGFGYLSGALAGADANELDIIISGLTDEVNLDREQNWAFWANATRSNLGVDWLDNTLSMLKRTTGNVVDFIYDDYLKSQDQELGLQSYGACVDFLVEYFADAANSDSDGP